MANKTGKKYGGRKKGTPNKEAKDIREAFQVLVENNLDKMEIWITQLAEKKPEKANKHNFKIIRLHTA